MNIKNFKILLLVTLPLLTSFVAIFIPQSASAIEYCDLVGVPGATIEIIGYGTYDSNNSSYSEHSISPVPSGTVLNFRFQRSAEPSSPVRVTYPSEVRSYYGSGSWIELATSPIYSDAVITVSITQMCDESRGEAPEMTLRVNIPVQQVEPKATIRVTSNMATGWVITGQENYGTDTASTYAQYTNVTPGTYNITPDNLACFSQNVTPSYSQNAPGGGTITFNITYTDNGSCGPQPPPEIVYGCTNSSATNYNPSATVDDGSCQYPPGPIYGCTDPSANNYNSAATVNDGSCTYPPEPPPELCNENANIQFLTPPPSSLTPGQPYSFTIRLANTGETRFAHGMWWRLTDSGTSGTYYSNGGSFSNLPMQNAGATYPGTSDDHTISAVAPNAVGSYQIGLKMLHIWSVAGYADSDIPPCPTGTGSDHYFGNNPTRTINVVPATQVLTVTKSGTGTGTVTSNPAGISCGGDCSESYSTNAAVTLTATPASGSDFAGWSGSCSGTGSCALVMSQSRTVNAQFVGAFNYSLSNSGTVSVTKGSSNTYGQSTISKNLISGTPQSVTLSLAGVPSGVSYSIANGSCTLSCSSTITFTVSPTATVGTHQITVTGSPLGKTTSFNLNIFGAPFSVTCGSGPSNAAIGQSVTWTAFISGGKSPFTYSWSGTGMPTNPAPTANPYSLTYSTVGTKTGQVVVRDADNVQATCPAATAQVFFDPNFEEF